MSGGHQCPDCAADPNMQGKTARPVAVDKKTGKPVPAKRCTTHHRAVIKARKKRTQDNRRQTVYGLTPDQYQTLLEAQGGRCFVCQIANGSRKALAVDHDHSSGMVRSICCGRCNFELLGRYTVEMLERAIGVLVDPPAPKVIGEVFVPVAEGNT